MTEDIDIDKFLAMLTEKPTETAPRGTTVSTPPTNKVEIKGGNLVVEQVVPTDKGVNDYHTYLTVCGLDPQDWTPTGFRSSEWTMADGSLGKSVRWTFTRSDLAPFTIDKDMLDAIVSYPPAARTRYIRTGDRGLVIAIGDLQIGKSDGDGVEGTVTRAKAFIDEAIERAKWWINDSMSSFISMRAPAVIVSGSDAPDMRRQWQRFGSLPAVKNQRFVRVDADRLHRLTPRLLEGVAELCAAVGPYVR